MFARICAGIVLAVGILCVLPPIAVAQETETVCDSVVGLLPEMPELMLSSRDTLATDYLTGRRVTGCWLWLTGPSNAFTPDNTPEAILRRQLLLTGWEEDHERTADGPDGTIFGVRMGSVLCSVSARWDGGDDSDPGYVPENRYEVVVSCMRSTR